MSITFDGTKLKKHTHDDYTVKKWTHDGVKVYSSGSVISYYNGSTLLGTKEYDEGADVLRPGYSPTKSGYTFVGWSKTRNGSRVTTLVAGSEPISLYAVFVANSLTILRASLTFSGVNPVYEVQSYDSNYISEPVHAAATGWYNGAWNTEDTQSMYVSMGLYRTMTVEAIGNGFGGIQAKIDGTDCFGKTITKTYSTGRYITMYAKGSHSDPGSWHLVRCGCTSIVLSNPPKWQ